ncbi:MAG: FAD-binding oxidoreductase [Bacteroidota bacterium]
MTLSYWQRGESGATLHCDIAVVGAGIVGTSTAYWLKKYNPSSRVVLIDAATVGAGATGRNAGFLLQGAAVDYATDIVKYGSEKAAQLWAFTKENRDLLATELDPEKTGFEASGSLILAGSLEEKERLVASYALLHEIGESVHYWSEAEISAQIQGKGFAGGLLIESGARVDSQKLVREIAGRSGAILLEHHPVYEITPKGDHIGVACRNREVKAARVVCCTNAYLPQLMPEISAFIKPVRAQMLATASCPDWLPYPVYSHEGYYYIRQLASGEVLLGGGRHLFVEEELGYDDYTTPQLQAALQSYLLQYFPHIAAVRTAFSWSGVMGFTQDSLPLFAHDNPFPGVSWAAGFNGHGMGYGFRFGKTIAGTLNDDPEEQANHNLFTFDRLT